MVGNIPNLWPELTNGNPEITPKTILTRQAMVVTEKTKGKVQGEVVTKVIGRDFTHTFWLVAPELDDYRHFVIRVRHAIQKVYPLQMITHEKDDTGHECTSEEELYAALKQVLGHPRTLDVVKALVSQSN